MSRINPLEKSILRTRIAFALRRTTGVLFDVDAMLRRPEQRARRIEIWRGINSPELNSLLDQLDTQLQSEFLDEVEEQAARAHAPVESDGPHP
ncbi:MAG: hypothetical protein ACTHL8_27030 [Burkholderiaceae bacterium]